MANNIFNPEEQNLDLNSKIVSGLERISEAFKTLLWDKAKVLGLSPIQIQILIFIKYHPAHFNNVSQLAKEFNLTKPTISDAIRVLEKKGLIEKQYDVSDQRRFTVLLTAAGDKSVQKAEDFADALLNPINNISPDHKDVLYESISHLISQLHVNGILSVQRNCHSCRYFKAGDDSDHCQLLQKVLFTRDIRLDCPEYQPKN